MKNLIVAGTVLLSGMAAAGPIGLAVEHRENPVGIDAMRPRLSWKLPAGVERQGAYEIDAGVWKSGRVASSAQLDIPWGGAPLASGQRVAWRVRAWDETGRDLGWSEPAAFVTGLLSPSDWKARWIASSDPEVTPKFVRRFTVGKGLKSATLHVTGVGFYTAELNAAQIGRKVLDPAPTDYDDRVLYSTYILDDLVRAGENELALTVGHGWFDVRAVTDWVFCKAPWRARPRAIAQLELVYADGRRETVVTDDSWREIPSGIAYDDIREGEVICGATDAGFGARVGTCQVVAGPKGRLVAEAQPGAEIVETHKPKAIYDLGEGRWFVDFGLDMAGWCEIRFRGLKRDDRVSICYDERSEDGRRPPRNRGVHRGLKTPGSTNVLDRAGAFQTDWYVAAGRPEETYEPRFVYHGFRYVTLTGLRTRPEPDDLTAKVINTGFRTTGSFRSSNETLNRLMAMADRSYRSNWTDGVPTDCPHREKNGWTGDASMASEVGQYLYENTASYEKWLQDVVEAQRADGMIPGIVPTGGWGCDFRGWGGYPGPCWDGALPVIAWTLYVYRGDRAILEKTYATLVRNIDFWERERTEKGKGLIPEGLGDWCPPFRDHHAPTPFVTTAWHCQNARLAARIADVLGKSDDAARFVRFAEATKEALNKKFLRTGGRNRGLYVDDQGRGFQAMQAAALAFDIVPSAFRADAERRLLDLVAERYDHLDVGIQGLRVLLRQLSQLGRSDLALKMLLQPTGPSFTAWIDAGSTSLREDYRSVASWNHIMFGDFAAWAYQYLAGIRLTEELDACGLPAPSEQAFRRFVIRPAYVPQLDFVEASVESPYGTIRSAWRRLGESLELSVTIPSGTEATVALPDGRTRRLAAGSYVFRSLPMPSGGLCAHRGDQAHYPENTVPAIRAAVEKGAAMVEFDVKRCKTGELVIMHDETVDRTTNGKGRVTELTFDEIRALDAGVKKDPKFAGVQVPTFDEAIDAMPRSGVWANIHIGRPDVCAEVAHRLKAKGRLDMGFIASGKSGTDAARAVVPEIQTLVFDKPANNWRHVWTKAEFRKTMTTVLDAKADFTQPHFVDFTPEDVRAFHERGGRMTYFWCNEPERLQGLLDMGVDFPLTDNLDAMLEAYATCDLKRNPCAGHWSVSSGECWLDVERKDGGFVGKLLWNGSPKEFPVRIAGNRLTGRQEARPWWDMKLARWRELDVTVCGDAMSGELRTVEANGKVVERKPFKATRVAGPWSRPGKRWPKYGQSIDLLEGGLDGWTSMNAKAPFGWSFKDGVLANRVQKGPDGKHISYANIKTKRADFVDFKLEYDVRVPKGSNSGVYLRGLYELQVLDSFGKPADCHNMAAPYGRITPKVAAERPAGAWQHVKAILFERHLTVWLNGTLIVDNEPIVGPTGGAMSSDVFAPGPIYLQGDHSDADFRALRLTPIVK